MKQQVIVVDEFYRDPLAMRSRALAARYVQPADLLGWRSRPHVIRGTRAVLENLVGRRIRDWSTRGAYRHSNGVFFLSLSTGARREVPHVHYDGPPHSMSAVVYLTPNAPSDAGTSFWKHRATEIEAQPTSEDAQRLGLSLVRLERALERDSRRRECWIELDRVANRFNRAVLFCPNRLHSASRHFGRHPADGRLYHCFHFELGAVFPARKPLRS